MPEALTSEHVATRGSRRDGGDHPRARPRRGLERNGAIDVAIEPHQVERLRQAANEQDANGAIDTCSRFCAFFGTEVILDLLSDEETERTSLKLVRSKPIPFPPEPVASVGVNLMRWALDRADHNEGRRNLFLRTMDAVGLGFDS